MKLLLDTHAFVWAVARSSRLSPKAASLIRDPANRVLVSAISAYEIEFKRPRDRQLAALPADLDETVGNHRFEWLALSHAHALAAGRLPRLARDPFDRLLAAQALVEQATILTVDPAIAVYGCVVGW